ncbi:hypothetical protein EDF58_10799 [Novosphingobium sp. PhB57]|uniref:hypothetical protein n=1 Tax=Novosphingobium sp. PhB57 TaxID=2485107 RepID=UPI0010F35772|nr:hypothetical protein [Novosphingobium sp. PhB57]TCU54865.1 hypothetical protein EDF58_10799 [Novosphingobium sp. PhB57]
MKAALSMPAARRLSAVSAVAAAALLALTPPPAAAQAGLSAAQAGPTDADVVSLAKRADMVVRAQVAGVTRVTTASQRIPAPGHARYYVEATTGALLFGAAPIGGSLRYLVDLPQDGPANGVMTGMGPAELPGRDVILFASPVPGRPEDLKLIAPTAQILWTPDEEVRLRAVLRSRVARNAPSNVTRVREMLYVPGNLAGQGRTQIFLDTEGGRSASITVRHEPGQAPAWGVSFSAVVATAGRPPARGTLEWYSLACFLPPAPAERANISATYEGKMQALTDYRMVIAALGSCPRTMS